MLKCRREEKMLVLDECSSFCSRESQQMCHDQEERAVVPETLQNTTVRKCSGEVLASPFWSRFTYVSRVFQTNSDKYIDVNERKTIPDMTSAFLMLDENFNRILPVVLRLKKWKRLLRSLRELLRLP